MTRILNADGRLKLVLTDGILDVATASDGRFGHDPQAIHGQWDAFQDWAAGTAHSADAPLPSREAIRVPLPAPRQIIGVGLNYHSMVASSGLLPPSEPGVFAKFLTSLAGPYDRIPLPSPTVASEAELAITVRREAYHVSEEAALDHIGFAATVQDLMDLDSIVKVPSKDGGPSVNYINPSKSLAAFTPLGPLLVSLDEVGDLDSIEIELDVNGVPLQRGRTDDMIFAVPELVARLSRKIRLLPGDVILTGSPSRLTGAEKIILKPGDVIRASVSGLGEQFNETVALERSQAA